MIENFCVSGEHCAIILQMMMTQTMMRKLINLVEGHLKQMAKKTKRMKILPVVQRSRYLDIREEIESSSDGKR